jgi:phosphoenolpyruvate synthase/pyruvate phosphate dikinase
MSAVLKEIAKRKYITEKQVRFATFEDIKKMLLEDVYDEAELLRRTRMCIYYAERGFEKVFVEEEAREIAQTLERDVDKNISELTGESGCIGYAKGKVKVIIRASDMEKMKEGDVLVSIATDPDIVPAMKKASAIITEQGGVTSHAAIVSRELGIPCVIGTKIATKVLKDGDMVEVDANRGIVKKL